MLKMQPQALEISIDEEKREGGERSHSLYSLSILRLWRPAAQRNLRNQWSIIVSNRQKWSLAATEGRSYASSLINLYLSRRYMPSMDLGVLGEMDKIKDKACTKLARRQDHCWAKLSASYKDLVAAVSHMVCASKSMRCFLKGPAGSPIVQFSSEVEHLHDTGDGAGTPVFSFLTIPFIESLAQEIVQMFMLELFLKRLLLVELHSLSFQRTANVKTDDVEWSKEIYEGEFRELTRTGLFSSENHIPEPPSSDNWEFANSMIGRSDCHPKREALQVYLTAWLAEVNVNTYRVNEIISMVEEEMKVKLV